MINPFRTITSFELSYPILGIHFTQMTGLPGNTWEYTFVTRNSNNSKMKKLFTILAGFLPFAICAQTPDSVFIGAGYANKVFYSMANGEVSQTANNNWHLAVATGSFSSAIRINGAFKTILFRYEAGDSSDWATLDTAGLASLTNWSLATDADSTYDPSAFETGATGHPNYGWGNYNSVTHDIVGDKLFVLKTGSGTFKKVWIQKKAAMSGIVTIRIADLDGANDNVVSVNITGADAHYKYVDVTTGTVIDNDAATDSYDLVFQKHQFTRYTWLDDMLAGYNSTAGVVSNVGVKTAVARNIPASEADVNNYTLTDDNMIAIGGYEWKTLAGIDWLTEDSISYFIEDLNGDTWQLWFTEFGGSADGKYVFNKRQVAFVSVEEENNVIGKFNIFPNPAADFVNVVYTIENANSNGTLSIMDLSGKQVYREVLPNAAGLNNHMINVNSLGLSSGVYMVRMQIGNSQSVQKLIVQ